MRSRFSEVLHNADWCLVTEFRRNISDPFFKGPIFFPETSVTNYQSTLRYIPEEINRLSRNIGY